ncbi:sugar phosphate isomerase/epimerase family protein [Ohessyouella blattaphilus]|uniref:Sugar phosphate isomerase/epimerase n=1 Tax=Ohessyouella blattaphilus TaxID=2949333 RepID=A0ABT1EKD0_9FIRM|nr:sugar phosphate isomerase/epimerase family protein [Ohessyouella blattaphilus]MCP1111160.1 sugar phosphate isomerase/epimerase [Ohessyouella blattaphilus]MCR8564554.1 sugar phosphate isomerase/epimerase [Ohessyouella blattaphilus]
MKLGGFGQIGDYQNIGEAGYDFVELDMPEIEGLEEKEFETLREVIDSCGFPVLTGARLFPIAEPLFFTNEFEPEEWFPYLRKVCERASKLGIKKIILGNGKARSLDAKDDRERINGFIEFLRSIADIAAEHGQELILEPLGPKYSNYIQTIPEAVDVIKLVNRPNIFTMADLRHMLGAGEAFENIVDYLSYIHHIHVDYPKSYPERKYPSLADDYNYDEFISILEKSGYNDTLTIEADVPNDWKAAYQQILPIFEEIIGE